MENKNVFNFGIPGFGAEMAKLSLDERIVLLSSLVEKAEKLKDEIEGTDLELHAIDNVLSEHREGSYEEEKQKLNDRADELMKRKEIIWPEFFSVGDTMVNTFRAITAEFPQGRMGPIMRYDEKAAMKAIDEKQPGLSERYNEVVEFFEELIRLSEK